MDIERVGPYRIRVFGKLIVDAEETDDTRRPKKNVHIVYEGKDSFESVFLDRGVELESEEEFRRYVEDLVRARRRWLLRFLASCMRGE